MLKRVLRTALRLLLPTATLAVGLLPLYLLGLRYAGRAPSVWEWAALLGAAGVQVLFAVQAALFTYEESEESAEDSLLAATFAVLFSVPTGIGILFVRHPFVPWIVLATAIIAAVAYRRMIVRRRAAKAIADGFWRSDLTLLEAGGATAGAAASSGISHADMDGMSADEEALYSLDDSLVHHGVIVPSSSTSDAEPAPQVEHDPETVSPPVLPRHADVTFFEARTAPRRRHDHRLPLIEQRQYDVEVAVRVHREGIPLKDGQPRGILEPGAQDEVTLLVTLDADEFLHVAQPVQMITLPPLGNSTQNAWFAVTAKRATAPPADVSRMCVSIYYEFNLLEVVYVEAHIAGRFSAGAGAPGEAPGLALVYGKRPREYVDLARILPRTMHVTVARRGSDYFLRFVARNDTDPGADEVVFEAPTPLRASDLEDQLVGARKVWRDVAMSDAFTRGLAASEGDATAFLRALAAVGRDLWVALFKRQSRGALSVIGRWLEQHPPREGSLIQVTVEPEAAEFAFPWSLLYDRPLPQHAYDAPDPAGFWGVRYCVEQQMLLGRPNTDADYDLNGRLDLAFLLWKRFANATAHQQRLEALVKACRPEVQISTPPITSASECYQVMQRCAAHVLYFYAHGYTRRPATAGGDPDVDLARFVQAFEQLPKTSAARAQYQWLYDSIKAKEFETDRSWIALSNGRIYLNELLDRIEDLPSGPLVFLNMCESAQVLPSVGDSFVRFFLDRGARAVIGTECPMTIQFADPFGVAVLRKLLGGETVGESLRSARADFVAQGNPLGLAYTLYGSAAVRFKPPRWRPDPSSDPPKAVSAPVDGPL